VLLPAWGGVGKSTLASRAVLHGRAKFLADDHALIDSIGRLHLHLLPVHLYAYHAEQDRLLRNRMLLADTAPNWQWTVGTLLDRKHAVRWISPVDLYGPDKMGSAVPIEQVVVMFRGDHTDFVWEPTDAPALVRPCAAVIFRELHGLADRLTVADAGWTKSFLPNPAEAYAAVCKVYEAAFSRAACAKLLIPRAATGDQLVEYLRRKAPLVDAAVAGT